jgi:fumarylpyruvate hydrolase
VVGHATTLPCPPQTHDLHHKVELVIALASGGANGAVSEASKLIFGYGVGVGLTPRDFQGEANIAGRR